VGAAIEYAVLHLHVKHLIICGHTDCGGIKALDDPIDQASEAHTARWLEWARPAQTQVDAQGVELETRHRSIVEQNVLNQLTNVQTYDIVRRAVDKEEMDIHGWLYDVSDGHISSWNVEIGRFVDESEL
jgi:carbonic anhydrase